MESTRYWQTWSREELIMNWTSLFIRLHIREYLTPPILKSHSSKMSDQAKANAIQDSSLASTQNMKRLLVEVDTKNIWCLSYCSKICRSLLTLISLQTEETGKNTNAVWAGEAAGQYREKLGWNKCGFEESRQAPDGDGEVVLFWRVLLL